MTLHVSPPEAAAPPVDAARVNSLADRIAAGALVPYLGPGALELGTPPNVAATPEALALALHKKVPVSPRIRGNLWSTAQFIESKRHRKTLTNLLAEHFAPPVAPNALHAWLALMAPPLIVDTWYDGAMRSALAAALPPTAWGEIQGITRAVETRDIWTKAYDATGAQAPDIASAGWRTVLYKPHGSIVPARNFLASDADYVEVLTEIDIQTPIPPVVKALRETRGFAFLGCRFHDQMLRTFARQIVKRSAGGHVAVVEVARLTRNERKFLDEIGAEVIDAALPQAVAAFA